MIGGLIGDLVGSRYESEPAQSMDFELIDYGCKFTDDSILALAVADAILNRRSYTNKLAEYFYNYPNLPYGIRFKKFINSWERKSYCSFGVGAATRAVPIGFSGHSLDKVLNESRRCTIISHDHPEGIRGAQATAAAIFLARTGSTKKYIREYISNMFGYDLKLSVRYINKHNRHPVSSCQFCVPAALTVFLNSTDFESAVRQACIFPDADSTAFLAGSFSSAFYKSIPHTIIENTISRLDGRLLAVLRKFEKRFSVLGNIDKYFR